MKKSNFVILVLSVFGGLMFSLGMCMSLIPEWNLFNVGIGLGCAGALVLLAAVIVYRKSAGCAPIRFSLKNVMITVYAIASALVFGTGMSMVLVNTEMMIQGILIGCAGILMFLGLIPMIKGLR